jgi:hypothetical protein
MALDFWGSKLWPAPHKYLSRWPGGGKPIGAVCGVPGAETRSWPRGMQSPFIVKYSLQCTLHIQHPQHKPTSFCNTDVCCYVGDNNLYARTEVTTCATRVLETPSTAMSRGGPPKRLPNTELAAGGTWVARPGNTAALSGPWHECVTKQVSSKSGTGARCFMTSANALANWRTLTSPRLGYLTPPPPDRFPYKKLATLAAYRSQPSASSVHAGSGICQCTGRRAKGENDGEQGGGGGGGYG